MKKITVCLIVLTLLCAAAFCFVGCSKSSVNYKEYDPSSFTESIDLADFTLVFNDDFEGELDRDIWGDVRQGTRRDGFWTKNLAYTDGDGNLVIRTEKRGSRWCSDTHERQVTGLNGTPVSLTYDDCFPFGMIAGDFGALADLHDHTDDLVGYDIIAKFDALAAAFATLIGKFDLPSEGPSVNFQMTSEARGAYTPFFETAMELYNYYAFVQKVKDVTSMSYSSAVIGVTSPYVLNFGGGADPDRVNLRRAVAHLYGIESEEELISLAKSLRSAYADYENDLAQGRQGNPALDNGCFRTDNGSVVFPIVVENADCILLTYLIIDSTGQVSVWVNDTEALLRSTDFSARKALGTSVKNEVYCKNVLFVTGPEGVYSGAIRTLDLFVHGFGYYEIRCKLPTVTGIWHAFWMQSGNVYSVGNGSADGVEIDVFEYLAARDAVNCALHWDGYDDAHQNVHQRYENTGLGDGNYHTFGLLWDEDGYAFYVDGKKVWHTTGDGVCPLPAYLLISTEYGEWGDWVGSLDVGDLPVDWVVDYVKVYDKKADGV